MVIVSRLKLFTHSALLAVAVLFLSANMATYKHLVHTGLAKLITFDHQVRRDLSLAERQSLKTSVLSENGDFTPNPLPEAAGTSRSPEIVLKTYALLHSPIQRQPKSLVLDSSPVLNL